MSVSCDDILAYAEQQLQSSVCEVGRRAAIGRAYYACFHRVKNYHEALDSPGDCGDLKGTHIKLISSLENPTVTDPESAKVSRYLGRMTKSIYRRRTEADYHIDKEVDGRVAAQTVAEAKRLFGFMDKNSL